MSAEPIRVSTQEDWSAWEGQVVNGLFPLRRFLGGSEHSGVFLTEYRARNLPEAAIKFIPADRQRAMTQLSQWRAAANFSHPHLMRLFDVGGFQFDGRAFLFVVMEHAEQTLAQVLLKRALTADEVSELIPPTLDALTFLHRYDLVHGQLKPSNVLVVNDQVKLSSDTIRAAGQSASGVGGASAYDAPESSEGAISTAGDVWSLGITLVEALTQRAPTWSDGGRETIANLPEAFLDTVQRCLTREPPSRPTAFDLEALYNPASQPQVTPQAPEPPVEQTSVEQTREVAPTTVEAPPQEPPAASSARLPEVVVQEWSAPVAQPMEHAPARQARETSAQPMQEAAALSARETATQSKQQAPARPVLETSVPPMQEAGARQQAPTVQPAAARAGVSESASPPGSRKISLSLPVIAGAVLIVLIAWIALRAPQKATSPAASTPTAASSATAPIASSSGAPATTTSTTQVSNPPARSDQAASAVSSAVLHEVIPDIPRRGLSTIRGHIKITVRVLVDPSGSVVGDLLERSGPSAYFARRAREAAAQWKFSPVPDEGRGSRVWLVRFDFSRSGVTAQATAVK